VSGFELDGTGVWSGQLRFGDRAEAVESAAELEELGYSALWVPDAGDGDVFGDCKRLLDATTHVTVATGILNLWMHSIDEVATGYAELTTAHPDRFLLGIGVSHAPLVDRAEPGRYRKPLDAMCDFLDALDRSSPPVPAGGRMLAALGPKMLGVARDRTRGAHPYLVNPVHTKLARDVLGPGPLLAPEQPVALETDATLAREMARKHLNIYLSLPNYVNNLKRIGSPTTTSAAVAATGSSMGSSRGVTKTQSHAACRSNRDAGADHVCVQALNPEGFAGFPREQWRLLAPALTG